MVKGRKPKPTHLKIIEGNPGKRRIATSEWSPDPVALDKPELTTEHASECWDRSVIELQEMGILQAADRDALEIYCEMYGTEPGDKRQRQVANEGALVKGRDGNQVTNPAWRIARDASQMATRLGEAFGFSPAARTRINIAQPHRDTLEAILSD